MIKPMTEMYGLKFATAEQFFASDDTGEGGEVRVEKLFRVGDLAT